MALFKCSECGQMISDKAEKCPKCGAPVMIPIKCKECGEMIPNGSNSCPHCGIPIENMISNKLDSSTSKLKIQWKGKYAMVKSSIKIFINNEYIGEYSYNNGFSVEVPITSSEMLVEVSCNRMKGAFKLQLAPNMDYICNLILPMGVNSVSGFSYELSDSYGNTRKNTDKLGVGMQILCVIVPIIGIVYYFMKRSEYPAKAKVALYCGLLSWVAQIFIYMIK